MKEELEDGTIRSLTAEEVVVHEAFEAKMAGPTPVNEITKLQCKRQAVVEDIWSTLKDALAADADMQEDWDLATSLTIDDPLVISMGTTMGKDVEALQTFFNAAAKL